MRAFHFGRSHYRPRLLYRRLFLVTVLNCRADRPLFLRMDRRFGPDRNANPSRARLRVLPNMFSPYRFFVDAIKSSQVEPFVSVRYVQHGSGTSDMIAYIHSGIFF